jgi:hypothetical protein
MLVFEDAIVISLRPVSVSFAMRLRSRPGIIGPRAGGATSRFASVCGEC